MVMKKIDLNNPIVWQDVETVLGKDLPWDSFRGSTVVITGASGMLASYMVFVLAGWMKKNPDSGMTLYLAVRNRAKTEARFGDVLQIPGVEMVDWHGTEELVLPKKVDYIVHAASIADSSLYTTHPVETALPNVIGTWRLLELALQDQAKGVLFFSSGDVYGKVDVDRPITERDSGYLLPQEIRSCYGESKRMAENLCAGYSSEYQVPACCVRIGHTYGPTINLRNDGRVFAEFVRNVVDGENIVMKSDGSARRPFCYITDAADAFFRVLMTGRPGESYNMCNDSQMESIARLAEKIVALFPEKGLQVTRKARAAGDTYAENKNANTQALDTTKLRALGWNPSVTIEEGFYRTITALQ